MKFEKIIIPGLLVLLCSSIAYSVYSEIAWQKERAAVHEKMLPAPVVATPSYTVEGAAGLPTKSAKQVKRTQRDKDLARSMHRLRRLEETRPARFKVSANQARVDRIHQIMAEYEASKNE